MKAQLLTPLALCAGVSLAFASDLDLVIESGGGNHVDVLPGASVSYVVVGELSDAANRGLALFCCDLSFDGGDLSQADAPGGAPLDNFATPLGINNPGGYGGTVVNGDLVQVGGGQNTIKSTFAPKPTGTVIPDLAMPGSPMTLISGSLTAPTLPGLYTLSASNGFVNVIRQGETGSSFWAVDGSQLGNVDVLTIRVFDCTPNNYCTAKVNSQGCTPAISSTGSPTLGGGDDFVITASNVINRKWGVLFWSTVQTDVPFQGGRLCVSNPIVRTPAQNSGGSPGGAQDCSGTLSYHFSQATMGTHGFVAGTTAFAQYFYRDPHHSDGTSYGLTDGLEFTVCP